MSTKITAAWRSSPPSSGRSFSASAATSRPDVLAEQVAHAFAFAQPVDHRVEPTLQLAEFGAVEHHQVGVEIALLDPVRAPLARPAPEWR